MKVKVVVLRSNGVRLDHQRTGMSGANSFDESVVHEGLLSFGTPQNGPRGRCLMLCSFTASPGMGVKCRLYQPTITHISDDGWWLRGFDVSTVNGKAAGVMQEWIVFPG